MLKNAYFLAKIGADTAENEQNLAEILPIGRRVAVPRSDKTGTLTEGRMTAVSAALPGGLEVGARALLLFPH